MHIVVAASDEQWNELTVLRPDINWQRVKDAADFTEYKDAEAFFCLQNNNILPGFEALQKPVIVNSVTETLKDLHAPENVLRINGWTTFLNRSVWEIAGTVTESMESVFKSLNIKINTLIDEPGFIAARIIAMIINEAFFAVADKVSTKAEIDTAMKLGTNYPFGPFEWAALIGLNNILTLLQKLNETDSRYKPSALLIKEVKEKN
ncbi:MAG: 3-hydroxyacyl-CoA dehydrogenase family protein [Ferruginibacter sp.]